MKLFFTLARKYPRQTILTLTAILFSGISEGFGISALLPILTPFSTRRCKPRVAGGPHRSGARSWTRSCGRPWQSWPPAHRGHAAVPVRRLHHFKMRPVYLANRQIGFTVVLIATDMRLTLLKSLFCSSWEYFIRQPMGRLTNGVATEANRASTAFNFGAKLSSMVTKQSIYSAMAFLVSWKATLMGLRSGGFIMIALRRLIKKKPPRRC